MVVYYTLAHITPSLISVCTSSGSLYDQPPLDRGALNELNELVYFCRVAMTLPPPHRTLSAGVLSPGLSVDLPYQTATKMAASSSSSPSSTSPGSLLQNLPSRNPMAFSKLLGKSETAKVCARLVVWVPRTFAAHCLSSHGSRRATPSSTTRRMTAPSRQATKVHSLTRWTLSTCTLAHLAPEVVAPSVLQSSRPRSRISSLETSKS